MSTGAIIAIVVVAVILLVVLAVVLPRMKRTAAERKLKQEREQRAHEHRTRAENQRTKAELAEQEANKQRAEAEMQAAEAQKQRAEADIHAKQAELHEQGMADHELEGGRSSGNGRTDHDAGHDVSSRETAGREETLRPEDHNRTQETGGGRFREVSGGGRAHEPVDEGGDGGAAGGRRFVTPKEQSTDRESRLR